MNVSLPSGLKQPKGKDLFSSSIWKDALSTSTFYAFIASLRQKINLDVKQTSRAHGFIRALRDGNRLIRCYTQNIDGLEAREGLCTDLNRGPGCRTRFSRKSMQLPRSPARCFPRGALDSGCEVVQLHGNLEVLKCSFCRATCEWEEQGREVRFLRGEAPTCPSCEALAQERQDRGKRGTKKGTLRPNIVLYGEENPSADIIGKLSVHDLSLAPDVLLILGTSLQVHGLKLLVREFAKAVHAKGKGKVKVILVNLSKPLQSIWKDVIDYWVSMDCDEWVDSVRVYRPDLWHRQTELHVQKQKPRPNPMKSKGNRNKKEGTNRQCGIECSSAPSQDTLRESKREIGIPEPKDKRGEIIRRKDAKEIISIEPLKTNVPNLEDMENDGANTPKATSFPDRHLALGLEFTSSPAGSPRKIRAPLRTVINESIQPLLNTPLAKRSKQVTMISRETGTVSPYFTGKSNVVLVSNEGWHQQFNPAATKAEKGRRESNTNQQLMTPPPSGRGPSSDYQTKKRRRAEDTDLKYTPVKRFKADLNIWQDEDIGSSLARSSTQNSMSNRLQGFRIPKMIRGSVRIGSHQETRRI